MKKCSIFPFLLLIAGWCIGQNNRPEIGNAQIQHLPAARQIVLTYDLADNGNDNIDVRVFLACPSGMDFTSVKGDVGPDVRQGKHRKIICTYPDGFPVHNVVIRLTASDNSTPDLQSLVDKVSMEEISKVHREIYGVRNLSPQGSGHLEEVKNLIARGFSLHGLACRTQDTALTKVAISRMSGSGERIDEKVKDIIFPIHNVIGVLQGAKKEDEVIIVSAHYDTTPGNPGADDNATGVAAVMEAARVLSGYAFDRTIVFVNFDQEEPGLLGSQVFVFGGGLQASRKIIGAINMDMIGYYSDSPNTQHIPQGYDAIFPQQYKNIKDDQFRGDFALNTANGNSDKLGMKFEQTALKYVPDLRVVSLVVPGNGLNAGSLAASDHAPFWLAGQPAIFIDDGAETRNPNYHTPGDTIDKVNYPFMTRVTRAIIASLADWAGLENSSSVTLTVTN
jgi:Peptidase family M28